MVLLLDGKSLHREDIDQSPLVASGGCASGALRCGNDTNPGRRHDVIVHAVTPDASSILRHQ
jgi:hypothetical protein